MEKRIDKKAVSIELFKARLGLSAAVIKLFNDLPEDPDGPVIKDSDLQEAVLDLFDNTIIPRIKKLVNGELPEVTEDDISEDPEPTEPLNPPENCVTQLYSKDIMVDGVRQPAYIFPKPGPSYSNKALFISFSDGQPGFVVDGNELATMKIPFSGKWVKYQSGTWDAAPAINTMEIYAERGSKPEFVTVCW